MKKRNILLSILVLVLNILLLTGCDIIINNNPTTTKKNNSNSSTTSGQVMTDNPTTFPTRTTSKTTTSKVTTTTTTKVTTTKPTTTTTSSPYKDEYGTSISYHWNQSKDESDTTHYNEEKHTEVDTHYTYDVVGNTIRLIVDYTCTVCGHVNARTLDTKSPTEINKSIAEYQAVKGIITKIEGNSITVHDYGSGTGEIVIKNVTNMSKLTDIHLFDSIDAYGHMITENGVKVFDEAYITIDSETAIYLTNGSNIRVYGTPYNLNNRIEQFEVEVVARYSDQEIVNVYVNGVLTLPQSNGLYLITIESKEDIRITADVRNKQ